MVHSKNADRLRLTARLLELRRNLRPLDKQGTRLWEVMLACKQCGAEPMPRLWEDKLTGASVIECLACGWMSEEGPMVFDAIDNWNSGNQKKLTGYLSNTD